MRAAIVAFSLACMIGTAVAEGDPEYGQYLSSECVTCHQSSVAGTIPPLAGMNADGFITMMKLYRSKQLDNPTMQTIAMRLSDADIAALAAYFSALEAPD